MKRIVETRIHPAWLAVARAQLSFLEARESLQHAVSYAHRKGLNRDDLSSARDAAIAEFARRHKNDGGKATSQGLTPNDHQDWRSL